MYVFYKFEHVPDSSKMNDDVGLVSLNIVETQTDHKKTPSNVLKFHMYEILGSLYGLGVCVSIYPCYL